MCLCWVSLGLVLLSLGVPNAQGQIPPVTSGGGSPAVVQFASGVYTVNENAGTAVLTVTLSGPAANTVTANYATKNGTAIAGTDYTAASGTVTFNPGVISQTISVGIIDNNNYSNQKLYFTVALSNPSSNATLGSPSTATVNILDNDPAPVADIEIAGVLPADKNNPGGFVQVNANNDNGSALTYADGTALNAPNTYGIPKTRDFDVVTPLQAADLDLVQVFLQSQNLKPGGPETISLSVLVNGRAKVRLWDTQRKNNLLGQAASWTAANKPPSVYLEGVLESAALREVTLTLQILNQGTVVSTDTCTVTVTPVLTNLLVTATPGGAPNIFNDTANLGWILNSAEGLAQNVQTFTEVTSAQWNNVRGSLRFIQNAKIINNLPAGVGASVVAPAGAYKWDYNKPNAGLWLVDCLQVADVPFYKAQENLTQPDKNGVVSNSVIDSPKLPLTAGPGGVFINSVLPNVGSSTDVDVTFTFVTYATIQFNDNSIYCLGQQSWNLRYAGKVSALMVMGAVTYTYQPAAGNANNSSGKFAAGVLNNANPAAIEPLFGNNVQAGLAWR